MTFKRIALLLSFTLPLLMVMTVFAVQGIAPFGEKSLAILDAKDQYISFSAFLADTLKSGDSLRYSWKLLLGGPMAGLIGYYLASPFELLFLFFQQDEILSAYDIAVALKLALSGLTMMVYLKRRGGFRHSALLFSTAYALSGFTLVFGWCIMWLDAVYMLPLIALGLDKITDGRRPFLYIISLGAAIIFSYYTGYMLCIFSVLYYIYLRLCGNHGRLIREDGIFCIGSLSATLLAAGMLFPVAAAMQGSNDLSFADAIREYTYPAIKRLYQCVLPGLPAETVDRIILPTLLCVGVLWLGLLCLAFRACLKESLTLRRRLFWILILILAVELWHSFIDSAVISEEYGQDPSGTWGLYKLFFGEADIGEIYSGGPNVYVGPLLLLLSSLYFSMGGFTARQKGAAAAILLVYYLSFTLHFPNRVWHLLANNHMFAFRYSFSFSFFLVIFAEECWRKRETLERKKVLLVLSVLLASGGLFFFSRRRIADTCEMSVDLLLLLASGGALFLYASDRRHTSAALCALIQTAAMLWTVNANYCLQAKNSLVREEYLKIEREADKRISEVRLLDSGLYRIRDTKEWLNMNDPLHFGFLGVSGFSSSERVDTTAFLGSIGVYSMISRFGDGSRGMSRAADALLGVRYLCSSYADYQEIGHGIYRNPYALDLAFIVPKTAVAGDVSGNAAETLNSLFVAFGSGAVYSVTDPVEKQRTVYESFYRYTIPEQGYYYLQYGSRVPAETEIKTDGTLYTVSREDGDCYGNMLYPLGELSKGSSLQIRTEDEDGSVPEVLLYREDSGVLEAVRSKTEENPTEIEVLRDDHLRILADIPADESLLIVSIPADKAWRITVDGVETDTDTAFGLFLAVPMAEGTHVVDLQYNPREIRMGLVVSCLTILGVAAYAVVEKKRGAKTDKVGKAQVKNATAEG